VPAAGEEHRDRQPGGPGRLQHHLQPRPRRGPLKGGPLHLDQARNGRHRLAPADHAAIACQHPHRVRAAAAQVDPDQPPVAHCCLLGVVACCSGGPPGAALHDHGPKATPSATSADDGSHSCAATGPDLVGSGHFPHPGHPWPAKGGNQKHEAWRARRPQNRTQRHPRNQPGCVCNPGTSVWIKHRSPIHEPNGHANDPDYGRSASPSCAQDRVRTYDQDHSASFPGSPPTGDGVTSVVRFEQASPRSGGRG
jgi:hypothetical protein